MSEYLLNNHTGSLKFVHITDSHLVDHARESFHGINTKDSLETVLADSIKRYPDIDFLLFTGDISQTGNEASYTLFKSVIEQYEIPIFCLPGNHDNPELLRQIIPTSPNSTIKLFRFGKSSLVLLNSQVENEHHGMISQHCLRQLDDYLNDNNGQFNIIAIHHPPVLVNSPWLDKIGLKNQTELLQVINKHSQNTLLIFGHVHQEFDQQLDRLRLLATPSSCYQFKVNSDYINRADTLPPAYRYISLCKSNIIDTKVHYIECNAGEPSG